MGDKVPIKTAIKRYIQGNLFEEKLKWKGKHVTAKLLSFKLILVEGTVSIKSCVCVHMYIYTYIYIILTMRIHFKNFGNSLVV